MLEIRKWYKQNVYGLMGTLIFHVLLFGSVLVADVNMNKNTIEEAIIIDFDLLEEVLNEKEDNNLEGNLSQANLNQLNKPTTNQAINDAIIDPFFNEEYDKEIETARELISEVDEQLSKEIVEIGDIIMPEETTDNMDIDSITNTIVFGESNIRYYLENRYHKRLPIPVYLAHGGGTISIAIWVDQKGDVKKTEIQSNTNRHDDLLPIYALEAAKKSCFNNDPNAPKLQQGTITYVFVAQ